MSHFHVRIKTFYHKVHKGVTKESKKLKAGFPSCYFVPFVVKKLVSSLNVTLSK